MAEQTLTLQQHNSKASGNANLVPLDGDNHSDQSGTSTPVSESVQNEPLPSTAARPRGWTLPQLSRPKPHIQEHNPQPAANSIRDHSVLGNRSRYGHPVVI